MPKNIGNMISGSGPGSVPINPSIVDGALDGVFNLIDQQFLSVKTAWPSPTPDVTSTGGTKVNSPSYIYHVFTSPDNFQVSAAPSPTMNVDYLIVGGGGGGGGSYGPPNYGAGGGGAGGFRTGSYTVNTDNTQYPVAIGGGGGTSPPANSNGSPSTAFSVTSAGGGRGASFPGVAAGNGGSGGGAIPYEGANSQGSGNNPPVSPPQGNPGGPSSQPVGGGGGGAGAPGGPGAGSPNANRGLGGDGLAAFSGDTELPSSYGDSGPSAGRFFAGGGGGGNYSESTAPETGTGGAGGGGKGGYNGGPTVSAGGANTGGGGGGSGGPGPNQGDPGGSGVVIVRYPRS